MSLWIGYLNMGSCATHSIGGLGVENRYRTGVEKV